MKFKLLIIFLLIASLLAVPASAAPAEGDFFDLSALNDKETLKDCREEWADDDVSLTIHGSQIKDLSLLRQMEFPSLELRIVFDNETQFQRMPACWDLLFPAGLTSVTFVCGKEDAFQDTEAMRQFVTALWLCCPEAELNGQPVSEWVDWAESDDHSRWISLCDTETKLHYLYDLAQKGELEVLKKEPVYQGKLMFLVMGDRELCSQECSYYGESFYQVPEKQLAADFDEADMAVFLYPVDSLVGTYANGGEAHCIYTRVLAVDLHTLQMYEEYTAVRSDPPENLVIESENGEYSTDGAWGTFEPQEAVEGILENAAAERKTTSKDPQLPGLGLLPWVREETETKEQSQTDAAAETTAAAKETETETTAAEPQTTAAAGKETQTTAAAAANRTLGTGIYSWLDEELLDEILNRLGEDPFRKTYEQLKNSKELVYGSKGTLALGVQKTLQAFDQNIAADSSIGDASLGALRTVQRAFGLEETSRINADIYARLMPCLLYYREPEETRTLLEDLVEEEDWFSYLDACVLYLEGAAYQARAMFESLDYADAKERAQNCALEMPDSGELYRNPQISGKGAVLTINVNSDDEASAHCVRIYTAQDELVSCLLIRGTDSAFASLPAGTYKMIDGSGYWWYGVRDMFGEEGVYQTMIFEDGADQVSLQNGYDYTITFNVLEHNESAAGVGAQNLSWQSLAE